MPMASDVQLVLPAATPLPKARATSSRPSAPTEKPNWAGIWLTSTVSAMPFM